MSADAQRARPAEMTRSVRRRAFMLAFGTASALGLARFAYGLLVPSMRSGLGWTLGQVGTQTTVNGLGYLAGALITTAVARRIGAAATFRLGMVLIAAALAASAASGDFGFQLATRAIAGLAGALVFITGGVIASRMAARAGGATPIVIYFSGAGAAIAFCGAILPPALGHHADRWPLAWVGLAATAVISTAVSWTAAREGDDAAAEGTAAVRFEARGVWRLWRLAASYLLFGAGYIAYITFLSAYLTSHHASVPRIAFTWALLGAAAVAAPVLWARPIGAWPGALALCALLALLAVSSVLALDAAATAVIGSAVIYGVTFLCVPAGITALIRAAVPRAGWTSALAVFTVLFAAGQTGGPYLAGALADRYGTEATLVWTAVLCAVAAAIAATMRTTIPRVGSAPEMSAGRHLLPRPPLLAAFGIRQSQLRRSGRTPSRGGVLARRPRPELAGVEYCPEAPDPVAFDVERQH